MGTGLTQEKDGQGNVTVTACSFTQPAAAAPEEIAILRRIAARRPLLGIFGRARRVPAARPAQSLPSDPDLRAAAPARASGSLGGSHDPPHDTDGDGRSRSGIRPSVCIVSRVDLKPPLEAVEYSGAASISSTPIRMASSSCTVPPWVPSTASELEIGHRTVVTKTGSKGRELVRQLSESGVEVPGDEAQAGYLAATRPPNRQQRRTAHTAATSNPGCHHGFALGRRSVFHRVPMNDGRSGGDQDNRRSTSGPAAPAETHRICHIRR